MEQKIKDAIFRAVEDEPFAKSMGMRLIELKSGYSRVEMMYEPTVMANIYTRAHGGAVFALIDEAFETASQTGGTIAVALNVNVSYVAGPEHGIRLYAEAVEISRSRKIANYDIRVIDENETLIATCRAMAYLTGKPLPF